MTLAQAQTELPKTYQPATSEPVVRRRWDDADAFHTTADGPGEPYCIVIPPPNVTAALHLGHALNNTLQDVLIRYHRMRGFNTLWMPGTDHAGIATQTVVEKRLMQQGKRRTDFSREEFIARVQAWKDEYEATIIEQLKVMGCSCDWQRTRFTMDDMCAKAVREAFFRLFKEGLIYRGKRLVNWDPVSQTALADDEVEMQEVDGHFWYLQYPLVHPSQNANDPFDCQEVTWSELAARGHPGANKQDDDEVAWVTVATTRPETYLGDTAVAVNPDDPRATSLDGLYVQLPLVGRVIPIVADSYVVQPDPDSSDPKAQYATGFLKVTPAHDPNDWEIGQRHAAKVATNSSGEVVINVMGPDASISDQHGWNDVGDAHLFVGKSREEARKLVVREFEARGLLEETKPYRHSVGHSYRSHVPIEPYLSDQWYVKVTDDRLVGQAQRALVDEQFEGAKPDRVAESATTSRDRKGASVAGGTGGTPVPPATRPPANQGDNELRFFPERYARTYQHWHDNLRDWCISRQLWWGHRIPVWTKSGEPVDQKMIEWWERIVKENEDRISAHITEEHIHVCFGAGCDDLIAQAAAEGFAQDPDVLDTWFSSGLWPLSTMGWPDPDEYPETSRDREGAHVEDDQDSLADARGSSKTLLDVFNPTSVLCTAREIITLWVSRMVMFNRFFNDGKVPYRHVYIHAMIQDGHGQKMSKSLGNGVDPRDIISSHGADALRFGMTKLATNTQDVRMPVDMMCVQCSTSFKPKEFTDKAGNRVSQPRQTCPQCGKEMISAYGNATGVETPTDDVPLAINTSSRFDEGRNFCNKLWNATRFALSNLNGSTPACDGDFSLVDRWIITRLHRTLHTVEDALKEYHFNQYAEVMYDFIWRDFCDWYLEAIKPTVRGNPVQQQVLRTVLNAALRMLHPICPFVTETLWPAVSSTGQAGLNDIKLPHHDVLARAPWPDIACKVDDNDAHAIFERIQEFVNEIRRLRSEHQTPPRKKITLLAGSSVSGLAAQAEGVIETLAGLDAIQPHDNGAQDAVLFTFEGEEQALIGLVEKVDAQTERARLTKEIEQLSSAAAKLDGRLNNPGYVNKAPGHLVEETRRELAEMESRLEAAQRALQSL